MEQKTQLRTQVAEITLSYSTQVKATDRPLITTSKSAYELLMERWDLRTIELLEQFKILLLNRPNRVLGVYHLSTGGLTGTVADPRLIFAAAIKACATSIILAHNHPSGNLVPGAADNALTQKIVAGGKLLDITVLDQLIISLDGFYSFADEGVL
jgi:DNA repair protein RadC